MEKVPDLKIVESCMEHTGDMPDRCFSAIVDGAHFRLMIARHPHNAAENVERERESVCVCVCTGYQKWVSPSAIYSKEGMYLRTTREASVKV